MSKKEKNNEIVSPIKKEVKKPFMKAISMIAIPLSITIFLALITIYLGYVAEVREYANVTPEEWEEYRTANKTIVGSVAGSSNYEEYKEKVWQQQGYEMIPFIPIAIGGVGLLILGIVARKSYIEGQKEDSDNE